MKKTLKITTGILAGTLSLTGVTNLDVATAQGVVKINVEQKNQDVTTQITEENGKNYIVVTAQDKEVKNLYVRAKASNNQNFVFKLEKLNAGQTVKFEVKLADVKVEGKKALPKTSVVKETVKFSGYIGEVKLAVEVTYEVEKEDTTIATEVKTDEKPVTPATPEAKPTAPTTPTTSETKPEEKPVTTEAEVKPEEKPAVPATPATSETKPEETTTAGKEPTAEEIKAAEEALKKAAENKGTETTTPATTEVKAETKPTTPVTTEVKAEEKPVTPVTPEAKSTTPVGTTPVSSGTSTRSAVQVTPTVAKATNVTPATQTAQVVGTVDEAAATQLFQLLNSYRKANDLPELTTNTAALSGATVRVNEFASMLQNGNRTMALSHLRTDGSFYITAFGGNYDIAANENLAFNSSLKGIMDSWIKSPSHDKAMKRADVKSVAIKVVKVGNTYYAVQIFGK